MRGYDEWLQAPYYDNADELTDEEREAIEDEIEAKYDKADRDYDDMKMRQFFGDDY